MDSSELKHYDCPDCEGAGTVVEADQGFRCQTCGATFGDDAFDDWRDDVPPEREIVVRIHRQDTVDWLDGDEKLADRYIAEVARRMEQELDAVVEIEDGYLVGGGSGPAYDSAVDDGVMQEASEVYVWVCEDLVRDWSWAETGGAKGAAPAGQHNGGE